MSRYVAAILYLVSVIFVWGVCDLKAESSKDHRVIKGDTLWGLSESYMKDPLLWPKIWKLNPDITNPHQLSPGQIVKIPVLEEKPALEDFPESGGMAIEKPEPPAEVVPPPPPVKKVTIDLSKEPPPIKVLKAPEPIETAEEKGPVVAVPATIYDRGIGIVTQDIPSEGRILHTESGWGSAAKSGTILIDAPGAVFGQRYGVYRDMGEVDHPTQRHSPGNLLADVGIIEVVSSDSVKQIGKVVRAFVELKKDDLLGPVPDMPAIVPSAEKVKKLEVEGTVIALELFRSLVGPNDIVYIDLGRNDGITPGDKLFVKSQDAEERRFASKIMVLKVTPSTAAALVTKESSHEVKPGDKVGPVL